MKPNFIFKERLGYISESGTIFKFPDHAENNPHISLRGIEHLDFIAIMNFCDAGEFGEAAKVLGKSLSKYRYTEPFSSWGLTAQNLFTSPPIPQVGYESALENSEEIAYDMLVTAYGAGLKCVYVPIADHYSTSSHLIQNWAKKWASGEEVSRPFTVNEIVYVTEYMMYLRENISNYGNMFPAISRNSGRLQPHPFALAIGHGTYDLITGPEPDITAASEAILNFMEFSAIPLKYLSICYGDTNHINLDYIKGVLETIKNKGMGMLIPMSKVDTVYTPSNMIATESMLKETFDYRRALIAMYEF